MADQMKVPVPPLPVVTKEEMAEYKAKVSSFRAMGNSARQGPGALTRFLSYTLVLCMLARLCECVCVHVHVRVRVVVVCLCVCVWGGGGLRPLDRLHLILISSPSTGTRIFATVSPRGQSFLHTCVNTTRSGKGLTRPSKV